MKTAMFALLVALCLSASCPQKSSPLPARSTAAAAPVPVFGQKMNGLTFVAPPEPFPENPMPPIREVGANWIAVVPYAFTPPGKPEVRYSPQGGHWWGERPEGVRETVRLAHAGGLKVMLKPQVWIPGGWVGTLDFAAPEDWAKWEAGYEKYILSMAQLADSLQVDLFCIGTEFNVSLAKRPQFWGNLISKIRATYRGKLTYSANWDDWAQVPFWSKLDFVGLGGYFPLVDAPTPSVEQLTAAWQPVRDSLAVFSQKQGKPILFTEYGYLSVDGCGWRNWELENGIESRPINQQAQANCLEALHRVFQEESWWAGGFLWKWFPNMRGHEGYPERDYTPQGKLGENALKRVMSYER